MSNDTPEKSLLNTFLSTNTMPHDEAIRECERRNSQEQHGFIEHFAVEVQPGVWRVASRLRPDWRRFSTSDRVDRPVKKGERFIAPKAITVKVLTHWRAPFTGGNDAVLPAGTILIANQDQSPRAPGFSCVPEDYAGLEPDLVPELDRSGGKYASYSLSFVLDDIGKTLVAISDA
jgi:hypothetical protein